MRRFLLAPTAIGAVLLLQVIAVHAFGPYTTGQTGYDVSFPQGNAYSVPPGSSFGIIGVNDGRPFSVNPYFGTQYSGLANSAYINTAYSGAYKRNITKTCIAAVPSALTGSHAQAWEIGCSEAEYSLSHDGGVTPKAWWLDVETANSWSSSNFTLNDDAIRGAADRLHALTVKSPVGIYTTAGSWFTITRNANFSTIVDGEWDAGSGTCPGTGTTGFTGAAIWLEQTGKGPTGLDSDTAC